MSSYLPAIMTHMQAKAELLRSTQSNNRASSGRGHGSCHGRDHGVASVSLSKAEAKQGQSVSFSSTVNVTEKTEAYRRAHLEARAIALGLKTVQTGKATTASKPRKRKKEDVSQPDKAKIMEKTTSKPHKRIIEDISLTDMKQDTNKTKSTKRPRKTSLNTANEAPEVPNEENVSQNTKQKTKPKRKNQDLLCSSSSLLFQAPGLPPGWLLEKRERKAGKFKGRMDSYWFSPGNPTKQFRSEREVKKFLERQQQQSGEKEEDHLTTATIQHDSLIMFTPFLPNNKETKNYTLIADTATSTIQTTTTTPKITADNATTTTLVDTDKKPSISFLDQINDKQVANKQKIMNQENDTTTNTIQHNLLLTPHPPLPNKENGKNTLPLSTDTTTSTNEETISTVLSPNKRTNKKTIKKEYHKRGRKKGGNEASGVQRTAERESNAFNDKGKIVAVPFKDADASLNMNANAATLSSSVVVDVEKEDKKAENTQMKLDGSSVLLSPEKKTNPSPAVVVVPAKKKAQKRGLKNAKGSVVQKTSPSPNKDTAAVWSKRNGSNHVSSPPSATNHILFQGGSSLSSTLKEGLSCVSLSQSLCILPPSPPKEVNRRKKKSGPCLIKSLEPAPGLPLGWLLEKRERKTGKLKGKADSYWLSPQEKKVFRSMKEVKRFLELLNSPECQNSERFAYNQMRRKSPKQAKPKASPSQSPETKKSISS